MPFGPLKRMFWRLQGTADYIRYMGVKKYSRFIVSERLWDLSDLSHRSGDWFGNKLDILAVRTAFSRKKKK